MKEENGFWIHYNIVFLKEKRISSDDIPIRKEGGKHNG
jgi:hypothetical protein